MGKTLLVILIIFIVFGICGKLFCDDPSSTYTPPPRDDSMECSVKQNNDALIVSFNETSTITDVKFEINKTYKLTIPEIKANDTIKIALTRFTSKDGTRFNPWGQAVNMVFIYGDVSGDTKYITLGQNQ
jgi:hypothetical protein